MIERLGNVLYWFACICALGCVGFAAIGYYQSQKAGGSQSDLFVIYIASGAAIICYLIGRAFRYVLSAR